jgi:hypothetical protein
MSESEIQEEKEYECRATDNLSEAESWQKEGFTVHCVCFGKLLLRRKKESEEYNQILQKKMDYYKKEVIVKDMDCTKDIWKGTYRDYLLHVCKQPLNNVCLSIQEAFRHNRLVGHKIVAFLPDGSEQELFP